jgi:hypothetical protein
MKRNAYSDFELSGEPDLVALLKDWQEIMPRLRKASAVYDKANSAYRPAPPPPELIATKDDHRFFWFGAPPVGKVWNSDEINELEHLLEVAKESRGGDTSGDLFARGEAILAAWGDWWDARNEARREVDETEWQLMQIENERDDVWRRFTRTRARTVSGVIAKAQVAVGCPSHLLVFEPLHLSIARDLRRLGQQLTSDGSVNSKRCSLRRRCSRARRRSAAGFYPTTCCAGSVRELPVTAGSHRPEVSRRRPRQPRGSASAADRRLAELEPRSNAAPRGTAS